MSRLERITSDPEICHGQPVIRRLRYPVQMLLELMSSGMTTDEILSDYADLEQDDLPDGNATTDAEICEIADRDERIVITKDRDFRNSHLLHQSPRRLLVVATGNITNATLLALFDTALGDLDAAFSAADFVELSADGLVIHARED